MERKISSSFNEFYKVYSILCIIMFVVFFGFTFYNAFDFPVSLFILLAFGVNLFLAYDFWGMKEVEITDAGLIITYRFFFTQTTIFVPFEQIENATSKFWWVGNKKRTSIKFTENTKFGKEICFISKGFTRMAQAEIIEEINRTIIRNKTDDRLRAAFHQIDN